MSVTGTVDRIEKVRALEERMRDVASEARAAQRELAEIETPFTLAAHIISTDAEAGTFTARVVLKDPEGFYAAVLHVGTPKPGYHQAVDTAISEFGKKVMTLRLSSGPEEEK